MTGYPPAAAPDDWPPPVRAALMNPGPMPIADVLTVAAHLGWGDMARLRDEVERLRDEADARFAESESSSARPALRLLRHEIRGERIGYRTVLDLIDKQREGQ